MKITVKFDYEAWNGQEQASLQNQIGSLIEKIQSNPVNEHLLAQESLIINLSPKRMPEELHQYLNQYLPQVMPHCRVLEIDFYKAEEVEQDLDFQELDEEFPENHNDFPISAYRSSLKIIHEHLINATDLRVLNLKFESELDEIDCLSFKLFSRTFEALPNPENLRKFKLSMYNGNIGTHGRFDTYLREPEVLRFLATLKRCTNLTQFDLSANFASEFFQDETHRCLSKLPVLESVSIKYLSLKTSIYSLAKILKNQSLKKFECVLSGGYYCDEPFDTLEDPNDDNPVIYRTQGESWRYFEKIIRQNSHLQSLKFNLNQVDDESFPYLTWDNEEAYFSTSFIETCHAMTLIPSLTELEINFPESIGRGFNTNENKPVLFSYFENVNHLNKLSLRCSRTGLDNELIQFSQAITSARLRYKAHMQKHFCNALTITQFDASSPEVLSPYLKLKMIDSLRLDIELARNLSPIIARSDLNASDETHLPSLNEINLAKQFSRDLLNQMFRYVPSLSRITDDIHLHIFKYLSAESIVKLSQVNGGLNTRLKKQAFERQYQISKETRNQFVLGSSYFLPNGQININHHYQAQELDAILKQRTSCSSQIHAFNAIELDQAFFDNHLENMLKPHLQSEKFLILPIQTPGHWVGIVMQVMQEGQIHIYYFDTLVNAERFEMVIQKLYNVILNCELKVKGITHANLGLIQGMALDSGVVLIENIAKFFRLPEVFFPTTLEFREFHASLISNFSNTNVQERGRQLCNGYERTWSSVSMFKKTSLLNEEGLVNLTHHYNAEDINSLLKARLVDQENVKIVKALRFDDPNFCYRIHHIMMAESANRSTIVIPINTGGHWVGMVIQIKNMDEMHLEFHDPVSNSHRTQMVTEKIIGGIQTVYSKNIDFSIGETYLCLGETYLFHYEPHSSGPYLVELMVKTVNNASPYLGNDVCSIRLSQAALLQEARNTERNGILGHKRSASEHGESAQHRMSGG